MAQHKIWTQPTLKEYEMMGMKPPKADWVTCLGPMHGDKVVKFYSPDVVRVRICPQCTAFNNNPKGGGPLKKKIY